MSVAIHFVVTMGLPDFQGSDSGIIPIEFLGSGELELHILPEAGVQSLSRADRDSGEPPRPGPIDPAVSKKKVEELSLGENLKVPPLDVLSQPISKDVPQEERIARIKSSSSFRQIAKAFEETMGPRTDQEPTSPAVDISPVILKEEKADIDPRTELIRAGLQEGVAQESRQIVNHEEVGVTGPLALRELTHLPPVPGFNKPVQMELRMKLWVSPEGTVDRVVPLNPVQDAELEKAAADYLRHWRFKPIPENKPQIEEWGTVTITLGSP